MCFWKKKQTIKIDSLYHEGDFVLFKNKRDEATNGYIYRIYLSPNGEIIYDIQVGGECPAILTGIPENKVIKRK